MQLKIEPISTLPNELTQDDIDKVDHLHYSGLFDHPFNQSRLGLDSLLAVWREPKLAHYYSTERFIIYKNAKLNGRLFRSAPSLHSRKITDVIWFLYNFYEFLWKLEAYNIKRELIQQLRCIKVDYLEVGPLGGGYSITNVAGKSSIVTIQMIPYFCGGPIFTGQSSFGNATQILAIFSVFCKIHNLTTTRPTMFFFDQSSLYGELTKAFGMVETKIGKNENSGNQVSQYFLPSNGLTIENLVDFLPKNLEKPKEVPPPTSEGATPTNPPTARDLIDVLTMNYPRRPPTMPRGGTYEPFTWHTIDRPR